ncbi:hypothetical protein ALC60_01086 [Trachymyrmex zeteki]|uniref:Uncharacterized protein n=1 Tax=Mycetomoellerius zeteki TaxID=64791 RepID=A0A151XI50_9HYME|nr:hypothetical protein ALC60_01086 [Trachymyrmex zeteki]
MLPSRFEGPLIEDLRSFETITVDRDTYFRMFTDGYYDNRLHNNIYHHKDNEYFNNQTILKRLKIFELIYSIVGSNDASTRMNPNESVMADKARTAHPSTPVPTQADNPAEDRIRVCRLQSALTSFHRLILLRIS